MWHVGLRDSSFFERLCEIDHDLAEQARARGCPCGGVLHRADYVRKPRGAPSEVPTDLERRHSFCCARDGCRRRLTPPSVRFLGRRVYLGVVVVLLTAMTQGVSPRRAARLRAELGVDRRTLVRWRRFWQQRFPRQALWREAGARFMPTISADRLPGALVRRFAPSHAPEGLVSLLRFLAEA